VKQVGGVLDSHDKYALTCYPEDAIDAVEQHQNRETLHQLSIEGLE